MQRPGSFFTSHGILLIFYSIKTHFSAIFLTRTPCDEPTRDFLHACKYVIKLWEKGELIQYLNDMLIVISDFTKEGRGV